MAILLVSLTGVWAKASPVNWESIEKLPPGTHVYVQIWGGNECSLLRVTDDKLFCTRDYPGSQYKGPSEQANQVFNKSDIRNICDNATHCSNHYICIGELEACTAFDYSAGAPVLLAGAGAGGGWNSFENPSAFAGIKLGISGLTMDLQYDRINSQNGFSIEGSGMIPVFRAPRWRPKDDRLAFRLYGEPGLGYRVGRGPFGQYASAKALVLIGSKWVNDGVSPYVEFQRRFPFNSPLDGDNRITFGFMVAVCAHCGLD